MMPFRQLYRWLRHPLVLFGATAAVLLGTLTWLAWHILQQDQALVDQRIVEQQGVRLALADTEGHAFWGEWADGNARQAQRRADPITLDPAGHRP